jgi:uracil-DNA glycosylase family 4
MSAELRERRDALAALREEVMDCRLCPRLVEWREKVSREKRAAFEEEEYWGRPVPGFGDPEARVVVVGLAPAAHGANRTGRMFTGDRSGDWLFRALHRARFASQPESTDRGDGLELEGAWITASVRCAPPGNKPTPGERETCRPYLERELRLLETARVVVCLGGWSWSNLLRLLDDEGYAIPTPRPSFGHGEELRISIPNEDGPGEDDPEKAGLPGRPEIVLLASYHPSQQNTFTGTLTEEMFDRVWSRARELVGD